MKANELRIGNWFIEYEEPQQFDGDFYHLSDIKFIPLTEEWLLKFGFLKDLDNDIFLSINPYAFLFWQNDRVELLDNDNNFMISYCKYVHQLQNLYFALTGEELTIKQ